MRLMLIVGVGGGCWVGVADKRGGAGTGYVHVKRRANKTFIRIRL